MKKVFKSIAVLSIALAAFSCNNAENQAYKESSDYSAAPAADSTGAMLNSSAAVEDKKSPERKFIRTADVKFKVKNVAKATYAIEDITTRLGGFVTHTNLTSEKENTTVVPVSKDSSLETVYYTVTNTMTLRVPNTELDTTLKSIAQLVDYLDYRIIKADDVALQLLSNQLTQNRSKKHENRLQNAISGKVKRLNDVVSAEDNLLGKQEQADNAKISNMALNDQVNFSTVSLAIYQRQTISRELIANDKDIRAYEPGFGTKLLDAFVAGWEVLEAFLVFLARLWGLFLFGLIIYFLYRKYSFRFHKG